MQLLGRADLLTIHGQVIEANELAGQLGGRSLGTAIARAQNRIAYGQIADEYDLAAAYAVALAVGHFFIDANKRTAYRAMAACLEINGIDIDFNAEEIGDIIIKVAQGQIDEMWLADHLRSLGPGG